MKPAIPALFFERLSRIIPAEFFQCVSESFERPRHLSVRVNSLKTNLQSIKEYLDKEQIVSSPVDWYTNALVILDAGLKNISGLEVVNSGQLYIQSLSSMLPVIVLAPEPGETVLDLCAAPGSKTSQMAAHMSNQGTIVAIESVRERFYRLKSVLSLLGVDNVQAKYLDGRRYHPTGLKRKNDLKKNKYKSRADENNDTAFEMNQDFFDRILVDAPCSSEGRFHTAFPKTFQYWSTRKIKEMLHKQRGLLLNACRMLKPRGVLVYSTCTFAPEENEGVVDWVLRKMPEELSIEPVDLKSVECYPALTQWDSKVYNSQVRNCCRVLPTSMMEGFFMAKIIRTQIGAQVKD